MKKLAVLVLLVCSAIGVSAQKNVLKVNPLSAIGVTANGAYERQISDQFSLQLGGIYTGLSFRDYTFHGYGITPEVHYYFPNQTVNESTAGIPEGFYLAPYVRYYNLNLEKEGEGAFDARVNLTGGGLLLGYQVLAGTQNNVAFTIYGGPGFLSQGAVTVERGEEEDVNVPSILSGFAPRFGLMVGIGF
jgi:hypothetical protein